MTAVKKTRTTKAPTKKQPDHIRVSVTNDKKSSIYEDTPQSNAPVVKKSSADGKSKTKIRIVDEETREVKEGNQISVAPIPVIPKAEAKITPLAKKIPATDKEAHHGRAEVIDLTKKIAQESGIKRSVKPQAIPAGPKSLGLYKRIAFAFVILAALLIGIIFYTSFVKVKITVVPNQEKMSRNMILDIYDKNKPEALGGEKNWVPGVIGSIVVSETKTYPTTGEKPLNEEVRGEVTIYNNYVKNQMLVASTRLLSTENKLFRIKNTVNVPAGGSVDVEVYADDPAEMISIPKTKFTIPGLWAGIQDKIYAQSKDEMAKTSQVSHFVSQADIGAANKDLKDALLKKAKDEVMKGLTDNDKVLYLVDEASITSTLDGEVNDEKESLTGTMSANVKYASFSSAAAAEYIRSKFNSSISKEKELVAFDDKSINYSLSETNIEQGTASVNANFEGNVSLKNNSDVIDRKNLVGLTKKQLEEHLKTLPEIATFNIVFSPSFVKRVPNLVDRIEIQVNK